MEQESNNKALMGYIGAYFTAVDDNNLEEVEKLKKEGSNKTISWHNLVEVLRFNNIGLELALTEVEDQLMQFIDGLRHIGKLSDEDLKGLQEFVENNNTNNEKGDK